jgi:Uncharacterized protein conserved in bacteria
MTYVALFRGINVGGKNLVKMAELRQMLSRMGFLNVKTYIQSGNAIFDSEDMPDKIKADIQAAFRKVFGFECHIVLRTKDEISAVISALPFSETEIEEAVAANADVAHLYFYFADSVPALAAKCDSGDKLIAGMGGIYLLCYESVRDSKLAMALAKQDIPMTARNWKTLNTLFEMM